MRTLIIECATEACSVALLDGTEVAASEHQVLGRGHAERLMPMIAALPGKGKADRIAVSRGPGSFTGVRVGIAAARALGVAWSVPVLGYPTLALVAATARQEFPDEPISTVMTAGHGEWFVCNFGPDGIPQGETASLAPEDAITAAVHAIAAGTQAQALVAKRGSGSGVEMHPNASLFSLMPAALLSDDVTPQYGRAPDAIPPSR